MISHTNRRFREVFGVPLYRQKFTFFMLLAIFICQILAFTGVKGQSDLSTSVISLEGELNDVAWSPNGQFLAAATSEGIKILDENLQEIQSNKMDKGQAISLTWSPDATEIATSGGSNDANIRVWNYDSTQNILSLQQVIQTDYVRIPAIAWSPDGKSIATLGILDVQAADLVGELSIWAANNWEKLTTSVYWYANPLMKIIWSPVGQMIAGGGKTMCLDETSKCDGSSGGVYVLNAETGEQLQSLPFNFVPDDISWSNTDLLAVASKGDITIFDTEKWNAINQFHFSATDLGWNRDGKYILSLDQTIDLINTQTGQIVTSIENPFSVGHFQWRPKGNNVVLWNDQGEIAIWNIGEITNNDQIPTLTPLPTLTNP